MAESKDDNGWTSYLDQFKTRPMTLVAVGKTGEGKSSTLNSLVNWAKKRDPSLKVKNFNAGEGHESISDAVMSCEISPVNFPRCRLVDTIGLFDTKLTTRQKEKFQLMNQSPLDEEHKLVLQQFTQVMELCKDGIDVFLFVVKARHRATKEETETIDVIFRYLGWNMLNYIIFVVTEKDGASQKSFEGWRQHICQLLEERGFAKEKVQDRFIFVDNKNPSDEQCYEILALAKFVSEVNRGCPYTPVAFQEAQRALEIEKQKIKEQFEKEFQVEVDKKIKPIEERHQANINHLQQQIQNTEALASQLKANQIEELKKYNADIEKMKKDQEEEKRRMKEESERQVKLLEQQKLQNYEGQMTAVTKMIGDITKAQADSNREMLSAIQKLQNTKKEKGWWNYIPVIGPILDPILS